MSYSIYISHNVVIWAFRENIGGGHLTRGLIYIVVSAFVGYIMLRVIERPFAQLRRRFSRATAPSGSEGAGREVIAASSRPQRQSDRSVPIAAGEPVPVLQAE